MNEIVDLVLKYGEVTESNEISFRGISLELSVGWRGVPEIMVHNGKTAKFIREEETVDRLVQVLSERSESKFLDDCYERLYPYVDDLADRIIKHGESKGHYIDYQGDILTPYYSWRKKGIIIICPTGEVWSNFKDKKLAKRAMRRLTK